MSLSAVRQALADLLEDAIPEATVTAFPPAVVIPPAVVVIPNDPYIRPMTAGRDAVRVEVSLKLVVLAGMNDNQTAIETLEELTAAVYLALPKEYRLGEASAPDRGKVNNTDLMFVEIPLLTTATL